MYVYVIAVASLHYRNLTKCWGGKLSTGGLATPLAFVFPIFLSSLQNVPGPITTTNCKLNRLTAIIINTLSLLKLFMNGMTCPPVLLR